MCRQLQFRIFHIILKWPIMFTFECKIMTDACRFTLSLQLHSITFNRSTLVTPRLLRSVKLSSVVLGICEIPLHQMLEAWNLAQMFLRYRWFQKLMAVFELGHQFPVIQDGARRHLEKRTLGNFALVSCVRYVLWLIFGCRTHFWC